MQRRCASCVVQEARSPKAASVLSESFVRICGGRTLSGQLGVEAWFRRDPPVQGVAFHLDQLTVIAFDPRLLAVKVRSPHFSGVLVCIHAPTAADPARNTWYNKLASDLDRLASSEPLVLAGDWNVRFSQPTPYRVGDLVWPDKDCVF